MARYLYRLGQFSVRRAWAVILVWVLLLGLLGAGAATLSKPFTTDITIPGTEFQNVVDSLQTSSPAAARGSGAVVFSTEEGVPFTPVQKQAIQNTLKAWAKVDGVRKAANPFTTQHDLDKARAKVKDAKSDIADGEKTIKKNQKKITDGKADIKKAKKTLDANAAKITSGSEQLAAGQAKLAAGQKTIDTNSTKLAAGEAQLAAGQAKLANGETQIAAARAKVNAGQAQLDDAKVQLPQAKAALTKLTAAQQGLTTAQQAITADQKQVTADKAAVDKLAAASPEGEDDPKVKEQRAALKVRQDDLDTRQAAQDKSQAEVTAALAKLPTEKELDAAIAALPAQEEELKKASALLDEKTVELNAGNEKLASASEKIADGKTQLEAGQAEINSGQSAIDLNQIKLATGASEIAQARVQLATAEEKLDDGQKKLDRAKVKIKDGKADLKRGERRLDLISGLRAVSTDGTTAVTSITFDGPLSAVTPATKEAIPVQAVALAKAGVQVDYSSDVLPTAEAGATTEAIGLAIAAIVLFVMLGSLLAAGLPLVIALAGVGTGLLGVLTLTHWVSMSSTTPALALMLGLAVGIDYALFLVHRHRQQLAQGVELRESIARAVGTAGGAVLFAGLTVVIALSALTVTKIPFLGVMGLAAAGTVAAAILVNLTLTPALLRLIGPRVLSPRGRRRILAAATARQAKAAARDAKAAAASAAKTRRGGGWGRLVTRHPLLTIVATVLVLGAVAIPAASLKLGLPDGSAEPHSSTAYQAYSKVSAAFGPGQNAAVIAVATVDKNEARRLTKDSATDLQLEIAEDLKDTPDVVYVVPASISKDRRTMVFQIVPKSGPNDDATIALVKQLRDDRGAIIDKTPVTSIGFAGQTVANIDISQKLADALPTYLAVVVGISLVLLLLVFRSIVVPLLATGGFLLSIAAAFGAVVAVYQWGWLGSVFGVESPGLILSFLPTLAIGILFGLAMDYQMFLVSGMREAWTHGQPARAAVRTGFSQGAKVVTAAALIMTAVFSSFIFSDQTMIKPIGFVLAVGVLVDAFLVRMTLMPAFMHLLGEKAWYLPRWLGRVLPDLDIEGTRLVAATGHPTPANAPQVPEQPRSAGKTDAPVPSAAPEDPSPYVSSRLVEPAATDQPGSPADHGRSPFARPTDPAAADQPEGPTGDHRPSEPSHAGDSSSSPDDLRRADQSASPAETGDPAPVPEPRDRTAAGPVEI